MEYSTSTVLFVLLASGLQRKILHGQKTYDCPDGWDRSDNMCYLFVPQPQESFMDAKSVCQSEPSILLKLNNIEEYAFILPRLRGETNTSSYSWWVEDLGLTSDMRWKETGRPLVNKENYFLNGKIQKANSTHKFAFIYDSVLQDHKFGLVNSHVRLSYICEIRRVEAHRVTQRDRDFLFGSNETDPNLVQRGPRFVLQPGHLVVGTSRYPATLECQADGYPSPQYAWYKLTQTGRPRQRMVSNKRVTITNGRLTFIKPEELVDAGQYQCQAINPIGNILSDPASLTFGYVLDFSNDVRGAVKAGLYQGAVIECDLPGFSPAVDIKWYKWDNGPGFLDTVLQPNQFVSLNGRLYFSEITPLDEGVYHCTVSLLPGSGQVLASAQVPSRSSKGFRLAIVGQAPGDHQPDIHNDFPRVYPSPPLIGREMTLECFAYGHMPLFYTWTKDGEPLPERALLSDNARVVQFTSVEFGDGGSYTCRVQRDGRLFDEKTIHIHLDAAPSFPNPLRDQHLDVGSQLTWTCDAQAEPRPVYTWFKDGRLLKNLPGVWEVRGNTLFIPSARLDLHEGMYQCRAKNVHGTSLSSAQLRVLSLAPTFRKRPVRSSQQATRGGAITILCRPEAAPQPDISWLKDDREIPNTRDPSARVVYRQSGDLYISTVQLSDEGRYTCQARNSLGTAQSTGVLIVVDRSRFLVGPTNVRRVVNNTAFLACQASHDWRHQDLAYTWHLNGHTIQMDRDSHFSLGVRAGVPGLYIWRVQLHHAGQYTCTATTVDGVTSLSAYLNVLGPPGECLGVRGLRVGRSLLLTWLTGAEHGAPIVYFTLYYRTQFYPRWKSWNKAIMASDACARTDGATNPGVASIKNSDRCHQVLEDLKPGSLYFFQVTAYNKYGAGPESIPSPGYLIPIEAPILEVTGIRSGPGSVGTLPIVWDRLAPEDHTGEGVGYRVYYRMKRLYARHWIRVDVYGREASYTAVVGGDNFYREYDVMISAFNKRGFGPNSTVTTVMSAEGITSAAPSEVSSESYNATAMWVYWAPIPDTRDVAKGKILGYQVNYRSRSYEDPEIVSTSFYCGNCAEGLVIGLEPNDDFLINVQVFTTAGMGPPSEDGEGSTYIFPPLAYPKNVQIASRPGNAVLVTWRGVQTGLLEETITGYKLIYWSAPDASLTGKETLIPDRLLTRGIIRDLEPGIIYALRVLAYSPAGDGKKSPTKFFTLEGQVRVNPETTRLMNRSSSSRQWDQNILILLLAKIMIVLYDE